MKKTMSAAFIVAALALTSACGGGDDRPTQDELKTSIMKKDNVFGAQFTEKSADCVAGVLLDSDVSDKTLQAIVDNKKKYEGSKADEKALAAVQPDLTACVQPATQTPDPAQTPEATETPAQ